MARSYSIFQNKDRDVLPESFFKDIAIEIIKDGLDFFSFLIIDPRVALYEKAAMGSFIMQGKQENKMRH